MDRVLRAYAHTAWTPADPLANLDPEVRRAILLMPSTFRERWKVAPWTDRNQRRLAIVDIVAERRLMYELTQQNLGKPAPQVAGPAPASAAAQPTSPYYRYRLDKHQQTVATMLDERATQDRYDFERLPEAKADHERRQQQRRSLLALEIERARLDVRELEILADKDFVKADVAPLAVRRTSPAKKKKKTQAR